MEDHNADPLQEGNGKYIKLHTLGKGSFGFVLQARNTETQEVVAIKLLPRAEVNVVMPTQLEQFHLLV